MAYESLRWQSRSLLMFHEPHSIEDGDLLSIPCTCKKWCTLTLALLGEQFDRITTDLSANEEKSKRETVEVFVFLNPIDLRSIVNKGISMKPWIKNAATHELGGFNQAVKTDG